MKKIREVFSKENIKFTIVIAFMIIACIGMVVICVKYTAEHWEYIKYQLKSSVIWIFIFVYCWAHWKGLKEKLSDRDKKIDEIIRDASKTNSEKEKKIKFYSCASIYAETIRNHSSIIIMSIIAMLILFTNINNVTCTANLIISIILLTIITIYTLCFCIKFKCIIWRDNDKYRKARIDELLKND